MTYQEIREKVENVLNEVRSIINDNNLITYEEKTGISNAFPSSKELNEWINDILNNESQKGNCFLKNDKQYWTEKKKIYDILSDLYDYLNDYNDDLGKEELDTVSYWMYEWEGEKDLNFKYSLQEIYRGIQTAVDNYVDEL